MLISIVTPSFNQGSFLDQTIRSVLSQDYRAIEYLVVDGGSTDGSLEIIQSHAHRLAYWICEKDGGQVDAIMKGFNQASGDILAWVNSDDMLAPSAATIAAEYLKQNASIGVVYGDRLHIDPKGNVTGISQGPAYYDRMFPRNLTIPQETAFFRKDLFYQSGGLEPELHFAMDFDLWCRFSRITRFKHIPAFLGYYREHSNSKSTLFHHEENPQSANFKHEQEFVYRRHFGRAQPNRAQMRWYRLLHKARLIYERAGSDYCMERENVRRIAANAGTLSPAPDHCGAIPQFRN